jgi:hypothetical protein
MGKQFEVRWEGELAATPEQVWDAITVHAGGYLWEIDYEPRVGGAERGLTPGGGTVTRWEPARHFTTRAVGTRSVGDGVDGADGADGAEERDGFNELDYQLERRGGGSYLRYLHRGVLGEDDYDVRLDACRRHTDFYLHSMGEYVRHFAGRDAAYVGVAAPESSAKGGFAAVRTALGLADDVAVGDVVRLTPAGLAPVEGVVDYLTEAFLGVRAADALYRVYGRDFWGWPVGVAQHLFAGGVDQEASRRDWGAWVDGVFADGKVA